MTSLQSYLQNSPGPADNAPQPGFLARNVINPIKSAFSGGIGQIKSGYQQARDAADAPITGAGSFVKNLGNIVEGGLNEVGGLGAAAASPLAPVMQRPIGAAVNATSDALSDIPAMQQFADTTAGQAVAKGAQVTGEVAGALGTGVGLEDIVGRVDNMWSKASGTGDTAATRSADATPTYDEGMAGQYIKNTEGEIVPRVNEGEGLTGKRTVNPSAGEDAAGAELGNLKNYPDKGTALQKSYAIGQGISDEAENMRSSLQAEDKANPLDSATEKAKVSDLVTSQMPNDIRDLIGAITPEDQAMLKEMQEKVGAPQPEGGKFDLRAGSDKGYLPKNVEGKYYGKVLDALNEYDGTREGKLDLRQKIDSFYKVARGKLAFGGDAHNALDTVNGDIRNALNKDLGDTAKNTDTQASLKKQTNLYRAKDVLDKKASAEAASAIGRFFQNHPILHRLVTRDALRILGTASGAGVATSFITKLLQGKE